MKLDSYKIDSLTAESGLVVTFIYTDGDQTAQRQLGLGFPLDANGALLTGDALDAYILKFAPDADMQARAAVGGIPQASLDALVGTAKQVPPPVAPTADEIAAQITADKTRLVQSHMDAQAKALGYDDIKTAVTYADEPAVPKFQIEGQALRAWRSQVWATCYTILAAVSAGEREIPSDDELIAALPAFEMPAEDATTKSATA